LRVQPALAWQIPGSLGRFKMKTVTTVIRENVKAAGDKKGERKEIGKIAFLVPTLEEVKEHLNTETAFIMEKEGEKVLDTYESNFSQFLADAIEAACKIKLFSKLEPKSIAFKSGQSLWTTISELTETSSTRGQHFAIAASFKAAITAFVTGLKKSDGWKSNVLGYLLTAKALAETSAKEISRSFRKCSTASWLRFLMKMSASTRRF
jgi:hypothetical protein